MSIFVFDVVAVLSAWRMIVSYRKLHTDTKDTNRIRPYIEFGRFKKLPILSYLIYYARLFLLAFWILAIGLVLHGATVICTNVHGETSWVSTDYSTIVGSIFAFTFGVHALFVASYKFSDPQLSIADPELLRPLEMMRTTLWRMCLEIAMLTVLLFIMATATSVFVPK